MASDSLEVSCSAQLAPVRPVAKVRSASAILAEFAIFGVPLFSFVLSIHQLKGGWDDGAITAAFGRTFAAVGRFSLTPVSSQVEGFSSVTWMFLAAVPGYFFHNPDVILLWLKLLAATSLLLSLLVFRRIAKKLMVSDQANMACTLVALVGAPVLESLNGMEMNLYMLLVLCLVDVLTDHDRRRRTLLIWALAFGFIATRFESPFLIFLIIVGLLFSREWNDAVHLAAASGTAFVALEMWRYRTFGAWMPNTVYAKMLQPYSPPHQLMLRIRILTYIELMQVLGGFFIAALLVASGAFLLRRVRPPVWAARLRGVLSILFVLAVLVAAWYGVPYVQSKFFLTENEQLKLAVPMLLVIALAARTCLRKQTSTLERLIAMLALAGVAFGAIFGRNWGHPGRMILPCIPFLVLAIVNYLRKVAASEYWCRTAIISCILAQALVFLPAVQSAWKVGDSVPVAVIYMTGRAADSIRQLAGLESLSIFTPDVGASSLYFAHLEILDSALLTNSYLAHHGYQASEEYLKIHRPQVIESYGMWSTLTRVYRDDEVIADYSLVVVDQTRLLLRNDLYRQIYARLEGTTGVHTVSGANCSVGETSYENSVFLKAHPKCTYISKADLIRNTIDVK